MENSDQTSKTEILVNRNKQIEDQIRKDIKKLKTIKGKKELEEKAKKQFSNEYQNIKEFNKSHSGLKQVFEQTDRLIIKSENENIFRFKSFEQLRKEADENHKIWLEEIKASEGIKEKKISQESSVVELSKDENNLIIDQSLNKTNKLVIQNTKKSPLSLLKFEIGYDFLFIAGAVVLFLLGIAIFWKKQK